jgi:hypothetical protein
LKFLFCGDLTRLQRHSNLECFDTMERDRRALAAAFALN